MALNASDVKNFNTLLRAAEHGHLAILESRCAKTGEYRAVIAAVSRDGDDYTVTPFGHMATGNPYEDYIDPTVADLDAAYDLTKEKPDESA